MVILFLLTTCIFSIFDHLSFLNHLSRPSSQQSFLYEVIALQILVLLLERPTDDSIEFAIGFTREIGAFLSENSPKANATVFERFHTVLNEGKFSQRVQYDAGDDFS